MERMKIEIEKSEYDRLKSREEKLMAYYQWYEDENHNSLEIEDIITKNIELEKEVEELKRTCNRYREKCEEYGKEITQLKIDLSNAEMSARCWEKVAKGID